MARIPYGKPSTMTPASSAGGVAQLGDIFSASAEQMRLVDNTNASQTALEEAYENWRRDIKAGTGIEPPANPLVPDYSRATIQDLKGPSEEMAWMDRQVELQKREFQQWVYQQANQYPAEATRTWSQRDPLQDATTLARGADRHLGELMESRPGWDKYVSAFAGSAGGSLRDPVTVGSLLLGGGPGAARTVGSRILTVAAKEALLNASTEALVQPANQAWREQAGLDSGLDQALANIAFAGALGGVLGAAGRGVVEGIDFARMTPAQRAALSPKVRGAIDAADQLGALDAQRPEFVSQRRHEDLVARAEIVAQRRELPPQIFDDQVQINRIVEALAPRPDSITSRGAPLVPRTAEEFDAVLSGIRGGGDIVAAASARPVASFVRSLGGVNPNSPLADELRSRGVTSRTFPGLYSREGQRTATAQGVTAKPSRMALDNIPIEEAQDLFPGRADLDDGNGYIREQAFIDAIEAEQRSRAATPEIDEQRSYYERNGVDFDTMSDDEIRTRMAEIADAEGRYAAAAENAPDGLDTDEAILLPPGIARRAYTEQAVREAVRLAGPGVGDDVIRAAVDLHLVERENLADAVDWAMSDKAGVPRELPAATLDELGSRPPAPAGIDDPGRLDPIDNVFDEFADLDEDMVVPFGDELVSVARLREDIAQAAWLERVVEACKI